MSLVFGFISIFFLMLFIFMFVKFMIMFYGLSYPYYEHKKQKKKNEDPRFVKILAQ